MVELKEWFTNIYSSKKIDVKLVNSSYLAVDGICNTLIRIKYGNNTLLKRYFMSFGWYETYWVNGNW